MFKIYVLANPFSFSFSFSLSNIPNLFFMGVYIYPINSLNYEHTDYVSIVDDINYWLINGDYNSRIGDINKLSEKSLNGDILKMLTKMLIPIVLSSRIMCKLLNILPLNHSFYRG